ncbi:FtsK/SpoIIIE domain-containing protein [Weissella sp. MSCH1]|uniref:FtsK/SpoIIIE domain-containing protein n=1 Tax=Weissella sp. MSCH1 TaxID=3383343 RepID=UPI003896BF8F
MKDVVSRIIKHINMNYGDNINHGNHDFDVIIDEESKVIKVALAVPGTMSFDNATFAKLYPLIATAARPQITVDRPEFMRIESTDLHVPFGDAFVYPYRDGTTERLHDTDESLFEYFNKTNRIPLMRGVDYDYLHYPHMLIQGLSGSGKTMFANMILKILVRKFPNKQVLVIDPKVDTMSRTMTFNPLYRGKVRLLVPDKEKRDASFLESLTSELQRIDDIMNERQWRMLETGIEEASIADIHEEPLFIVIDELGSLVGSVSKKPIKDAFLAVLTRIGNLGRSAGVFLILISQNADATTLPTNLRRTISFKLALGNMSSESLQFMFPDLTQDSLPILPTDKLGGKGRGLLSITGQYDTILPLLTPFQGDTQ